MITSTKKQGYDVIVVGGGIAGCCAALAAARENKTVLLVEKHINLGGLATIGLISWFEPLCDGEGRKMMSGMAEEMIRLACDLFTGKVPSNDLLNALEILKYSYHMDYRVDAKDIYFSKK